MGKRGASSKLFKKSLNSSAGNSSFEKIEAKLKLKVPSGFAVLVGVVARFYLAAPLGVVLRPLPRGVVLYPELFVGVESRGEGLGIALSSSNPEAPYPLIPRIFLCFVSAI